LGALIAAVALLLAPSASAVHDLSACSDAHSLEVTKTRGDRTPVELFVVGFRVWETGLLGWLTHESRTT
jgi:hypothetical protein